MLVERLSFEETQSAADADWARREFVEASYARFDFWLEHHREPKTLEQEASFQARMRDLLEKERDLWAKWEQLEAQFVAEMTVKFNPPDEPSRDNIFSVLGRY